MSKEHYPHAEIEPKWQAFWVKNKTFRALDPDEAGEMPKYYALDMFPYPSGSGLHVGHPEGYTATDIISRKKRMQGYNVLHPMGWDAFGLPAEQHAIQTGTHPRDTTQVNIDTFRQQIQRLGLAYDWDREVDTTDPNYYKWTQWIFLKLYEQGLAYEAEVPVWWCPALGTVLANEEVIDGLSERGSHPVERVPMRQWMLKITAYAERLLEDLEELDWPESIKAMQRHWIGKSEGCEVRFVVQDHDGLSFDIFTTRPDTLYGATYMVLAPEHPLVDKITAPAQREAVSAYQKEAAQKTELDRTDLAKGKTGVFTGAYAIHPLTEEPVPIWISDYVLITYGTGAIMAVPAHDTRDWEFAETFDLPIRPVVMPEGGDADAPLEAPFTEDGVAIHSGPYDGLETAAFKAKVSADLEARGIGKKTITYRLRDWLFSRQRYWGEPFPILFREDGSHFAIPYQDLPLTLPEVESYQPSGTGESPLATITEWMTVKDPETGEVYRRESNTMPQWAGSCWYFLRYLDPHNDTEAFTKEKADYWMPVDLYVGGAEHAVLHLLYARFWYKVLYDLGLVSTKEPFQKLVNQGMILGSDNQKMSKSRGNVVNPDDIVDAYGADAMRLYEMFMGPLEAVKPWQTEDIVGISRFLDRVWKLGTKTLTDGEGSRETQRLLHQTIEKVGEDIDHLRFNTAISQLMILTNHLLREESLPRQAFESLLILLNPFAPHITEELASRLGRQESLASGPWPSFDPSLTVEDEVVVVFQVNGKIRAKLGVAKGLERDALEAMAREHERILPWLEGKTIRRVIVVPDKLVNIVVS